ncbi:MAG: NAD(P)-dependent oxidoreductase [Flavobacteriales bacterium]|jgi:saccharopine dehydrogenase (NAD+, L-lysine-forming)|tara:strand:+ start:465 stop:1655 length:1191 start_codon:yes stop_codon:yes gene_type:complete
MNIGILKEEKFPADKRVAFSPNQCKKIISLYPNINIYVQKSDIRCYNDEEYIKSGINVVDDVSNCDILFGIKEVPKVKLIANKTYFFFSHTIKEQEYNRDLLLKMISLNISMIDYEVLKSSNGNRLLGFGRFAGIVGAYNAFLTYGLKSKKYSLKPAYKCIDRIEMEQELSNIKLNSERFIITGKGRVGLGILEIFNLLDIKEISKVDFLTKTFDYPVFVSLDTMDYNIRKDNLSGDFNHFIKNPSLYNSSFMKFVKNSDVFIAGHYYGSGSPFLFNRNDVKSFDFNLSVVADVSCDIDGPVATTIRPSTISKPIYGYNPETEKEDDFLKENVIAVMAVDNLPCELPKDSSEDFGVNLIESILPLLFVESDIIEKATICKDGDLTKYFEYLRDYIS